MRSEKGFIDRLSRFFKDIFFGMFYLDLYKESSRFAKQYKDFMYLMLLGEFLGLPLLSNTITFKLVPYLYKDIITWKMRMVRDKDVTDEAPDIG
jgi:hypothetical protein